MLTKTSESNRIDEQSMQITETNLAVHKKREC